MNQFNIEAANKDIHDVILIPFYRYRSKKIQFTKNKVREHLDPPRCEMTNDHCNASEKAPQCLSLSSSLDRARIVSPFVCALLDMQYWNVRVYLGT